MMIWVEADQLRGNGGTLTTTTHPPWPGNSHSGNEHCDVDDGDDDDDDDHGDDDLSLTIEGGPWHPDHHHPSTPRLVTAILW